MDKFGRNYVLLVQKKDGSTIKIMPPFTVQFDIHRNSFSSANVAQLRIYNLSPNNRKQIRKNQFDTLDLRQVSFAAGYGNNLSLAFVGNISQAWSVREGNNMITQIESFDGGYAYINAVTDQQFPRNTLQKSIIESIASTLPGGVKVGAIGSFPGQISRGNSYSGSTPEILSQLSGDGFFIDNQKAHCLNDNECIAGNIPLINAKSGLLGTPVLEQQYINFDMLFEPGLKVGQLIKLESVSDEFFNGTHKILSIRHHGMISSAVCGEAITSLGVLPGTFVPVPETT